MPLWRERYPGVEDMTLAVMGCVVNGPGESKHADVGISLPGTNETPVAPVYVDGRAVTEDGHIRRDSTLEKLGASGCASDAMIDVMRGAGPRPRSSAPS